MTEFSKRLAALPGYPMAELPAIKRRLIQQGVDLIDVGAGDADFPPPRVAVAALTQAIQDPAMSSRFPTAHPSRHPVMQKLFESEWNSTATSRAPGISKMLGATYPSKVISQYGLS